MIDRVYLLASYAERDSVKALGARYDGERRRWFVPTGMVLAPFIAWLPEALRASVAPTDIDVVRGVSLAQRMGRVSRAVAAAFGGNEWVRVEVVDVKARGHVYLELAERDGIGKVLAQARRVIW